MNVCPYCGEDAGFNDLGYRRLIHPHHQAGSPFWAKWYAAMREQGMRQTEVGDLLYAAYQRRAEAAKISLAKMHEANRLRKEATDV